jgi:hypothetical protein
MKNQIIDNLIIKKHKKKLRKMFQFAPFLMSFKNNSRKSKAQLNLFSRIKVLKSKSKKKSWIYLIWIYNKKRIKYQKSTMPLTWWILVLLSRILFYFQLKVIAAQWWIIFRCFLGQCQVRPTNHNQLNCCRIIAWIWIAIIKTVLIPISNQFTAIYRFNHNKSV